MILPLWLQKMLARPDRRGGAADWRIHVRRLSDRAFTALVADGGAAPTLPLTDGSAIDLNATTPPDPRPGTTDHATAGTDRTPRPDDQSLRRLIGDRSGGRCDPSGGVLVTPGAAAAFATVLDAFADRGDVLVLLAPCSPLFVRAATARGVRIRWVPTHAADGGLRLDFDALSRAMRGAKLIAVADPGNPLGLSLAADDADRVRWAAERSDVLLYVDQAYRQAGPLTTDEPLAGLAPARTLVAGSVAGLRGSRVGWLTGPTPLVRACELVHALSFPGAPAADQDATRRALASGSSRDRSAVDAIRRDVAERLRAMGFGVQSPTDGFFLWAEVGRHAATGREFAARLWEAAEVRVGPGDLYGPGGERFVRLSVGGDPGRLREGLTRLARFVGHAPAPRPHGGTAAEPAYTRS